MEWDEKYYGEIKSKYSFYPYKTTKFFEKSGLNEGDDEVTVEEPIEIRLCREDGSFEKVAVTMRTPTSDFDLAVGFLFTEGIIRRRDEILDVSYSSEEGERNNRNVVNVAVSGEVEYSPAERKRNFNANSSCGICGKSEINQVFLKGSKIIRSEKTMGIPTILNLPSVMREHQEIFNVTGGIHAAGVFDYEGNMLHVAEDIGRHNAVDKVVGRMLMNNEIPATDRLLQISGRAGFEIAQKAVMAGFSVLSSVSAP